MTAVDVDALAKLRETLSEALGQLAMRGGYGIGVLASERLADALLPVVDRIANQRAAAELHKAADDWRDRDQNTDLWLRARAYRLAPEAHGDPS